MRRDDYTIYHTAHKNYLQKHSVKCRLLSNEKIELFDGTGYESFSKMINTCVANCPTEIVIIFSHKVYPFPDEIEKILSYLDKGYAFVCLFRFAFFGIRKDLFRQIGFLDERFIPGGEEDEDFFIRLKEADLAIYASHESIYGRERSGWRPGQNIITPSKRHYSKKWSKRRRNLKEEKYAYDLGPSTNYKYLTWKHSIINVCADFLPSQTQEYNIYDKILLTPPFSEIRDVERYTDLNRRYDHFLHKD